MERGSEKQEKSKTTEVSENRAQKKRFPRLREAFRTI